MSTYRITGNPSKEIVSCRWISVITVASFGDPPERSRTSMGEQPALHDRLQRRKQEEDPDQVP
jgi:hypothetical protein